jgi:predicted nucleic acid-binding protein
LILADTSVWIHYLRFDNEQMHELLNHGRIVIHPFVVAELSLGSLKQRSKTITWLDQLPRLPVAQLNEVRVLIEARHLYGLGIGLIDAHLIASVLLNSPTLLWTKDKQLRKVAAALGIHADLD